MSRDIALQKATEPLRPPAGVALTFRGVLRMERKCLQTFGKCPKISANVERHRPPEGDGAAPSRDRAPMSAEISRYHPTFGKCLGTSGECLETSGKCPEISGECLETLRIRSRHFPNVSRHSAAVRGESPMSTDETRMSADIWEMSGDIGPMSGHIGALAVAEGRCPRRCQVR